ncbi:MAG: phosphosulfolactate phosphohydrolase, partial [Microbacterium sp.]
MSPPFDQSLYQVRFEWGGAGLERLAPADIVIVVDVLQFSTAVVDRVDAGATVALDDTARAAAIGGAVAREASPGDAVRAGGAAIAAR